MSLPMALVAEKPLVQVRSLPSARAVCSTGKLEVRQLWAENSIRNPDAKEVQIMSLAS